MLHTFRIIVELWLFAGTFFVTYGLFHLWQKKALMPRLDFVRAIFQIVLWPMLVCMAIDKIIVDIVQGRQHNGCTHG